MKSDAYINIEYDGDLWGFDIRNGDIIDYSLQTQSETHVNPLDIGEIPREVHERLERTLGREVGIEKWK